MEKTKILDILNKWINNVQKDYDFNFTKLLDTIKAGNTNKNNIHQFVERLFILKEFEGFLKLEKDNFEIGEVTYLIDKDYEVLDKYENIIDELTELYYNSDYGTSYRDFEHILKQLVYEYFEENKNAIDNF